MVTVIHLLDLLIVMELFLWTWKKNWSIVWHLPFEPLRVSEGISFPLWLSMEQDIMSFQLQLLWWALRGFFNIYFLIHSRCITDIVFIIFSLMSSRFQFCKKLLIRKFTVNSPHEIDSERWLACRHSTAVIFYQITLSRD